MPFYCPIPTAINPLVDTVEKKSLTWLAETGICDSPAEYTALVGTNSAEFYARIVPGAEADRLLPAVNWCYWGFSFDDRHCDRAVAATRLGPFLDLTARVLRAVQPMPAVSAQEDPYVTAVAEVADQFRGFATPTQLRRWANAHYGWLTAAAWQMSSPAGLPLEKYLAIRLNACAGEPTTAMIEMVLGAEIPAAELDSPAVIAVTEAARLVAALDNDLVSRHKEARLGQVGGNVVDVIARQRGCPEAEAVQQAVGLRDRTMSLFLRLCDVLRRRASAELRCYLDSLGQAIRGNIEWSLRVPRYHTSPADESLVRWADRPSDDRRDPLPVPAISWWWQQLN